MNVSILWSKRLQVGSSRLLQSAARVIHLAPFVTFQE